MAWLEYCCIFGRMDPCEKHISCAKMAGSITNVLGYVVVCYCATARVEHADIFFDGGHADFHVTSVPPVSVIEKRISVGFSHSASLPPLTSLENKALS